MSDSFSPDSSEVQGELRRLYREFFDLAERRRRWSVDEDIPWARVNPTINPAIADVVESFCAVESYLPDYIGKALPMVRSNKGWAWFHVNWGYEESKHSMVLRHWLIQSGMRTEEQMVDLETTLFAKEYELPQSTPAGMVIYAMIQELATFIHYRRLQPCAQEAGDQALVCEGSGAPSLRHRADRRGNLSSADRSRCYPEIP